MLTQIWSATDIMFCHFRPFFAALHHYSSQNLKFGKNVKKHLEILLFHTCTKNQDYKMYGSLDIKYKGQFFVILGHVLPFDPPDNPKNQYFEKKNIFEKKKKKNS